MPGFYEFNWWLLYKLLSKFFNLKFYEHDLKYINFRHYSTKLNSVSIYAKNTRTLYIWHQNLVLKNGPIYTK